MLDADEITQAVCHKHWFFMDASEPVLRGRFGCSFQNDGNLLDLARCQRPGGETLVNRFDQRFDIHRFDQDFIGLKKNGMGRCFHLRKALKEHGDRRRIGVAHGGDNGETVAMAGHMEVAEKNVEVLGADVLERLNNRGSGSDMKAVLFQNLAQTVSQHWLVVDEQDLSTWHRCSSYRST